MKERLSKAFKETPERFTYEVESAISDTKLIKNKKRLAKPLRVIIATVLVLAILPSAVFGAVKFGGAIAQRVGIFGLSFNITINEDAPVYVKMNIDVPKGFREQPNSGRQKFDRDTEDWEFGFTILPMKFYESVDYTVLERDVKEYNKIAIASRPAYELIGTDDYQGLSRYFVWYEEANVLILIYRGETVTDSEFEAFVDCFSFTEGTENDHDRFYEPERDNEEIAGDNATYEYEREFIEIPSDTGITFLGYCEETGEAEQPVKSVISDIRVTDNINGLDSEDINPSFILSEVADSDGKLLPKVVEIWQNGDGVNTESKLLSAESKNQKLVLIDIEYTNTTDNAVDLYIPHRMEILKKDEAGKFSYGNIVDKAQNITANEYCDAEILYLSSHGDSAKEYYVPTFMPNETKTITLGFRCNEEQLKDAYITLNPAQDGVITPDYSDSTNTYIIIKVQ